MYKYKKKYNWKEKDYLKAIEVLKEADYYNQGIDDDGHADYVALYADVWSYEQGNPKNNQRFASYNFGKDNKKVSISIINNSFDAYESPSSGKTISNHRQRDEDLKETGCVEYDPGVKQDYQANIKRGEKELDKQVDDTVEAAFEAMPVEKKERLENELKHSELEYTRAGNE